MVIRRALSPGKKRLHFPPPSQSWVPQVHHATSVMPDAVVLYKSTVFLLVPVKIYSVNIQVLGNDLDWLNREMSSGSPLIGSGLTSSELRQFDWLDHAFGSAVFAVDPRRDDDDAEPLLECIQPGWSPFPGALARPAAQARGRRADHRSPRSRPLHSNRRPVFPSCWPIPSTAPSRPSITGWRGIEQGIVGRTRSTRHALGFRHFFTRANYAAIGPGIGACCYEVGEDVARRFGFAAAGRIDLAAINHEQLIRAGVPPSRIDTLGLCTYCDSARFHSYRRDGEQAGRMISFVRVLAPGFSREKV